MSSPGRADVVEETTHLVSGAGLLTMTYLGLIPGFVPALALAILAVAILLAPALVLGAAIGAVLLVVRLVSRAIALLAEPRFNAERWRPGRGSTPVTGEPQVGGRGIAS